MATELVVPLALAAATVGALHSLAPDHWLPIAAVGRARGWSTGRTARVALLCGFGHVTVSVLLGLIGLFTGQRLVQTLGVHAASVSGLLLVGFGIGYAVWGLRHHHRHHHHHDHHAHDHDHVVEPSRTGVWTLFGIYCADPCVAVIPILFAAASTSAGVTLAIVAVYELATISTMVALAALARAGAGLLRGRWTERWGDGAAGLSIAATGIAVALLGW